MCDPISLIGMAVSGMSSIASYEQQKQAADQQNQLYAQNETNAIAAFQSKQLDSNTRIMQEAQSTAENNFNTTLKAQQALAQNMVAAGESGAYGPSSEALMQSINAEAGRSVDNANTNLAWTIDQIQNQKQGYSYEALNQINSVKRSVEPSFAGAMLGIAGAGVKAMAGGFQSQNSNNNFINSLGLSS